jgi:hypothetical protein
VFDASFVESSSPASRASFSRFFSSVLVLQSMKGS